jgi:hypothetical protein
MIGALTATSPEVADPVRHFGAALHVDSGVGQREFGRSTLTVGTGCEWDDVVLG